MRISSRTPEGRPNRCPVCESEVVIDPSELPLFGDAPCPNCGSLLWFMKLPSGVRLLEYEKAEELRDEVIRIVAERLGVDEHELRSLTWKKLNPDSLDVVELALELEEKLRK